MQSKIQNPVNPPTSTEKPKADEISSSIKTILKNYLNQFDETTYDYITNMIIEDSPDNERDLYNIIGDFFADQIKYTNEEAEKHCKSIFQQMKDQGFKSERKIIIAEKLLDAVKLGKIQVGSENTITSLNFDPNALTREKILQEVELSDKHVPFKKEVSEELRKHLEETKKMKAAAPDIVMHHDRDESYKVDINIESFTISIGGKTLIEDANLQVAFGRRYVLVGRNGIGKTTLLNHISRKEIEGIPRHLQILHVEQEAVSSDTPLLDEVLRCDKERSQLLDENASVERQLGEIELDCNTPKEEKERRIKALTDKMLEINQRLQFIGVDEAVSRATDILKGLGFSQADLSKATKKFSGGWRMRISLAKALFVQPDVLLLDEPTNHLDMNAVMWLEDYLLAWPYTLVIVSHARDFINNVATDIMHIQNTKLYYYKGNYDDFEKTRSEKMRHLKKQKESQEKKISHMTQFIDKFRANAKRASLVQSRIKALNKIDVVEQLIEDPTCLFIFPNPDKLNPPLLKLDSVDLGYSKEDLILRKIDFAVDMSSRYAVVGPNGAGKTTLLKAIIGELEPFAGKMYRHNKLKLAMFTQHHIDQLDEELTPIEQIASMYYDISNDSIRAHLASFGISGNLALRPNYLLSGGQKTRVAFAALVYKNPHIILMDEPTNHLDIDAVNALALALNNFTGGIVIVSHDQHFVESVCDKIYIVQNHGVQGFKGNFNDYKKYLRSGN